MTGALDKGTCEQAIQYWIADLLGGSSEPPQYAYRGFSLTSWTAQESGGAAFELCLRLDQLADSRTAGRLLEVLKMEARIDPSLHERLPSPWAVRFTQTSALEPAEEPTLTIAGEVFGC